MSGCPECGTDRSGVRAHVGAHVPRALHEQLKAEARGLDVPLGLLVEAKLRESVDPAKLCRACAEAPKRRQRQSLGQRPRAE